MPRVGRWLSAATAALALTAGASISWGVVIAHHVEAFAPSSNYQYAPLNYHGSSPVTMTFAYPYAPPPAPGQYLNQTFHALDTVGDATNSTYSFHADLIGSEFYGSL